jgi:hypothetical protein
MQGSIFSTGQGGGTEFRTTYPASKIQSLSWWTMAAGKSVYLVSKVLSDIPGARERVSEGGEKTLRIRTLDEKRRWLSGPFFVYPPLPWT